MRKAFSRWVLRLIGFRIELPEPLPKKCVVPVVPHTSNWDFPIGLLLRAAIETDIHFVGKDSLFRGPMGPLMRWLGGHPVDRSKRNNFVDAVVDLFGRLDELRLSIAPEGTRKKATKLKTGFYWIARGAGVPIVLCQFDWGNRILRFSRPFHPTENAEADMDYISRYFSGVAGFRPAYSFEKE